jgi:hypothetical protein
LHDSAPEDLLRGEFELRIIEMRLRQRRPIAQDLLAWETPEGEIFLPFALISAGLGFPISEVEQGEAAGWFLRESQTVRISLSTGSASVAGRTFDLNPTDARLIDGALHVSLRTLNEWFLLEGEWFAADQVIDIDPAYLLPQEEAQRRARTSSGSSEAEFDTAGFVRADPAYAWLSWPVVTANLSTTLHQRGQTLAGIGVQNNNAGRGNYSASLLAQGDFLWMSGRMALSASGAGDPSVRLTLARYDESGGLLGPLAATFVELGDVAAEGAPLLGASLAGVGVRFGRSAADVSREFDRFDLLGDAPPGWQAELYRDSELLTFQTISEVGRYAFLDTPLTFGLNRFRVELYGPSGERRTIDRTVDIATGLIRPKELRYSVVALREGDSLLGERAEFTADPTQSPHSELLQAQAGIGLTRTLALNALVSMRRDGGGSVRTDAGAGLILKTGPLYWQGDAIWQQAGSAQRVGLLTGFGAASLSINHEWRSPGFLETGLLADGPPLRSLTALSLDLRWRQIGATLSARTAQRWNGSSDTNASFRLSAHLSGLSFSHSVTAREFVSAERSDHRVDQAFALSGTIAGLRLRAAYDAEILPDHSPRSLRFDASSRRGDWYFSTGISQTFEQDATDWRVGVSRDFNGVRFGVDVTHLGDRDEAMLAASLSFATDRRPTGGVRFGRDARGQRGSVIARVFRDADGDGRFGPGDALIAGAQVESFPRARATEDGSSTLIEDLPAFRAVAIRANLDRVDEPYLAAAVPGLLVTPRPGRLVEVEIPLLVTGEAELRLVSSADAPLGGHIITIVPTEGGAAIRSRTAFDGLAFFGNLPPGHYRVHIGGPNTPPSIVMEISPGHVYRSTIRPETEISENSEERSS